MAISARAEAAVAAATEGRAQRAAAGPRHRTEARRCPGRPTTQTVPRRLHSRQTASSGSCGRRPVDQRDQELAAAGPGRDRAAAQLAVDGDEIGDRAGLAQRFDVARAAGRPRRGRPRGRTSCGSPGCRRRSRTPRCHERCVTAPQADDLLGLLVGADRALDEEDVERPRRAARGRLRRTRRCRTARRSRAARPRGRAGSAGSRRTRRT